MRIQEQRRMILIQRITGTLIKAKEVGKEVDRDKLIAILGADNGIARRTAIEYIKSAEVKMEMLEEQAKSDEQALQKGLRKGEEDSKLLSG